MSRGISVLLLIVTVTGFALAWRFGLDSVRPRDPSVPSSRSATPSPDAAVSETNVASGAGQRTASGQTVTEAEASIAKPRTDLEAASAAGIGNAAVNDAIAKAGPDATAPSFDIVRVEPDGSVVIAGRAAPNETVAITNGVSTLAEARANASGEFALDLTLPAGEHRLRLSQAAQGGGGLSLSDDAAVVSIPSQGSASDLLVLMERPGQPSEILVRPQARERDVAALTSPSEALPAEPGMPVEKLAPASSLDVVEFRGGGEPSEVTQPAPSDTPAMQTRVPVTPSLGDLAVEAVEIENGKLFVAGAVDSNSTIRIYLDETFVTEATGGAGDRFIASAMADVSVGDHVIRADEIGPNGEVVSRVEVPFNRPDTASMSAIASAATADDANAPLAGTVPLRGSRDVQQVAAMPTVDAAASDGPPASDVEPSGNTASASDPGSKTLNDAAGDGLTLRGSGELAASEPASEPTVAAGASPPTLVQAPLEPVQSRVIIRRGDTLWRISRETYGRGSRYTVIYLANGDQIRDPNRIYPGQVFRMPKDEASAAPRG